MLSRNVGGAFGNTSEKNVVFVEVLEQLKVIFLCLIKPFRKKSRRDFRKYFAKNYRETPVEFAGIVPRNLEAILGEIHRQVHEEFLK